MDTRLTIDKRMTLGIISLVLSLLALSYTSLRAISTLGNSLNVAVNTTARKLDLIGATQAAFRELRDEAARDQTAYSILAMEHQSATAARAGSGTTCSACHTPAPVAESIGSIEAAAAAVRRHTRELQRLVSDETSIKALGAVDQGAADWLAHGKEYLTLASGRQFEAAHAVLMDEMFPILQEVEKAAVMLSERERRALVASNQEAQTQIARNRWTASTLIGLNLLVAAGVLWLVRAICRGTREAVGQMSEGAAEVVAAARQVTAASASLAQGASEQAAALQETAASSEEIGSVVGRNAENSRSAAELATRSHQQSAESSRLLEQMLATMGEVSAQSAKISKVITAIDEIAFQTNILALNAAVEAARAGAAGTGFAVVADEVRTLAQRSAQAAKDTAALIDESVAKSNEARARMDQVAGAFRAMTEQTGEMKILVEAVSSGSREQERGIEDIRRSVAQMSQITQKTAAVAEENAAAARQLNAQSETLRGVVARMTSMLGSRHSTAVES